MTTTPGAPRRRFAISIRALMVAVLVVGGLIGWRANRARSQRLAVATIRAAKGTVSYDFQDFPNSAPRAVIQAAQPPGPAWLRRWVGDEYFQEVDAVVLDGPVARGTVLAIGSLDRLRTITLQKATAIEGGSAPLWNSTWLRRVNVTSPAVTDADLAILGDRPDLQHLWLTGADISDEGLAHLAGLRKLVVFNLADTPKVTDLGVQHLAPILPALNSLELPGTRITDASMAAIGQIQGLSDLDLSRTRVTDDGLAHLAGLIKLKFLWLGDTAITDRGLAHLRGMNRMTLLILKNTAITDQGLAQLAVMTEMRELDLSSTPVTGEGFVHLTGLSKLFVLRLQGKFSDAGMPYLAKLPALQNLTLIKTLVTDQGLAQLHGMPGLRRVATNGSGVTDAGYAAFRQATPSVKQGSNRVLPARPPATPRPK